VGFLLRGSGLDDEDQGDEDHKDADPHALTPCVRHPLSDSIDDDGPHSPAE
jgi:hypothetical protein